MCDSGDQSAEHGHLARLDKLRPRFLETRAKPLRYQLTAYRYGGSESEQPEQPVESVLRSFGRTADGRSGAASTAAPHYRLGTRIIVRRSEFDRWMAAYRSRPSEARALAERLRAQASRRQKGCRRVWPRTYGYTKAGHGVSDKVKVTVNLPIDLV